MYHYAGNNPVKYIDPDGYQACPSEIPEIVPAYTVVTGTGLVTMPSICNIIFIMFFCLFCLKGDTLPSTQPENVPKIEVFHSTTSPVFADQLVTEGNSVIDKSLTNPKSRFGQQFYVASDRVTAKKEASGKCVLVRFSMDPNARILDLANPETAKKMGYSTGMSREDARNLMNTWDLTGIDAIRYPSEQNPGGFNYAVINPLILTPEGVEP